MILTGELLTIDRSKGCREVNLKQNLAIFYLYKRIQNND